MLQLWNCQLHEPFLFFLYHTFFEAYLFIGIDAYKCSIKTEHNVVQKINVVQHTKDLQHER